MLKLILDKVTKIQMKKLQKKVNTSIIIITHNLGVVSSMADRVVVMYGGRFVECGDLDEVFYDTKHPYTKGLLRSFTPSRGHRRT